MSRLTLRSGLVVVTVLLLAGACGWKRAANAAVSGGTAGIYSGSVTYYRFPGPVVSPPRRLLGAIRKDGVGYFIWVYPTTGDVQVFRRLAGYGTITSFEYAVPPEGHMAARGAQKWEIRIEPGISSGQPHRLLGKFNRVDGYAALELRELPPTRRYTSLATRSGLYRGVDSNRRGRASITLHSDGKLSGTNAAGCRIAGHLTRAGGAGLFDVHMTLAGAPACRSRITGVAFFGTRARSGGFSAAGPYLYLIGASGDFGHGVAMVLMRWSK